MEEEDEEVWEEDEEDFNPHEGFKVVVLIIFHRFSEIPEKRGFTRLFLGRVDSAMHLSERFYS